MNTQYKQLTQKDRGFTIIEVVLVLAIAGLIFLMVFLALPALQRGQRDAQRKDDISRISTQIQNYASANKGSIPTTAQMTTATTGFVVRYLGGSATVAGSEYQDPGTGTGYTITTTTADPTDGQINYQTGFICGTDGATTAPTTASTRKYVLRIKLEGQTSPYCLDNR